VESLSWCEARYPVSRKEYSNTLGKLREDRVKHIFEELLHRHLGFEVITHHVNGNGPDLVIKHNGKVISKFEIMNENVSSYIDVKRAHRFRNNLRGVRCKGIICSHKNSVTKNKEAKRILKDIPIIEVGFQTLPESFYAFYKKRGKTFKRRIANDESLESLKDKILSFILHNEPFMFMYMV